jgi:hypothetical protein
MTYDPEDWLITTVRTLKSYVVDTINAPKVYDVVMEFPGAQIDAEKLPISKTIIHFELDAVTELPVGFGDTPMVWNYNAAAFSVQPQWAHVHRMNFDVGIWASDKSGGTTQRMRARQWLTRLFQLPEGAERLRKYSDAGDGVIEVLSFSGGRFLQDTANDVRQYRMVDGTLEIRVYSRTPLDDSEVAPAIEEIDQAPGLTIIG